MAWLLDRMGIRYKQQYPVLRPTLNAVGKKHYFFPDFVLQKYNIAIECDGKHWHRNKESEASRQKVIEDAGYRVLRFTGAQIRNDLKNVGGEIKRVINNHEGKYLQSEVVVVKKFVWKPFSPKRLYNFAVDEDESYVAKGFVVHNCRCTRIPVTKSWRELGLNIDDLPPGTRATMNGMIPGRVTFKDWFPKQPAAVQMEILGKKRYQYYKEGKIGIDQFATNTRVFTIKQLRRKYGIRDEGNLS